MACVLAWDLSLTSTGYAVGTMGRISESGLILGKFDGVPRLIYVRDKVCALVDVVKPDLVVMEALSFMSKGAAVHENAALHYMIRAELHVDKTPCVTVSPLALKKYVCGSGGSSRKPVKKEHVMLSLFQRWGLEVRDNNIADATVLAFLGMALMGDMEPTIDPQREVLAKVREGHPWLKVALPGSAVGGMEF